MNHLGTYCRTVAVILTFCVTQVMGVPAEARAPAGPTTTNNTKLPGPAAPAPGGPGAPAPGSGAPTAESPTGPGGQPQAEPKLPPVVQQREAGTASTAADLQAKAAGDLMQQPSNMQARQQFYQATATAGMANAKLDDLVKQGYSDKGLKEFRAALAAKAMAPVSGPQKKDAPESESKEPREESAPKKIKATNNQNTASTDATNNSSNGDSSGVITPVDAASYVKDRILQDLKRSQVADTNARIVAPALLSSESDKGQASGTTAMLLRQVDSFKRPLNEEVPNVGSASVKTKDEGRLLFDPSKKTSGSGAVGSTDTAPKTEEEKEIREKIKSAAKEYLGKLAKAPDSGNPREASLQQAIRVAQEDENVYDGLLNEIAAAFESDRLSRMTSYVPQDSINSPIEANPLVAGRSPASLDTMDDAGNILSKSNSKRSLISWPSTETKIPLLLAMAVLLAILVVWSSQGKPTKRR